MATKTAGRDYISPSRLCVVVVVGSLLGQHLSACSEFAVWSLAFIMDISPTSLCAVVVAGSLLGLGGLGRSLLESACPRVAGIGRLCP